MYPRILVLCSFLTVFSSAADTAFARRGIPIPVVWGKGEELKELGELPPEVAKTIQEESGKYLKVAYLYERAHVFWMDIWTWNGRHVLYSGDEYWEPDSETWQAMIGGQPAQKYGKPILYRVPVLPALILLGVVGISVRKIFFKTEDEKLAVAMNDQRYQKAIQTIFGSDTGEDDDNQKFVTSIDHEKFRRARDELVDAGVKVEAVDANLQKISNAILANTNAHIDSAFEAAAALENQGDLDQSAEIYTQLADSLPHNDERFATAVSGLESVNAKRSADESAGDDEPQLSTEN